MKNQDQTSGDEGKISGISLKRKSEIVFTKWQTEKKNLPQIADELNLPIAEVQEILTKEQKLRFPLFT
ncbi:MAG TPA: hypothetical protein VFI24_10165 [Pyrinomonadaceae bacterium]|nr:hypothetical protein [Pyrinomonadaceae bacterium]